MPVIDEEQIPSDTVEIVYTPEETALMSLDFRHFMTDASGWESVAIERLSDKLSEEDIREYPAVEDAKKTFNPQHLARESRWEGLRCIEAMRDWSYSMSVADSRELRRRWERELDRALDKAIEAERGS